MNVGVHLHETTLEHNSRREWQLMRDSNDNGNVWKGLVAGLAGGLVASWTMNQFQAAWTRIAEGAEKPHGAQSSLRSPVRKSW